VKVLKKKSKKLSRLCKRAYSLKSNKLMSNHWKLFFAVSDVVPKLCTNSKISSVKPKKLKTTLQ